MDRADSADYKDVLEGLRFALRAIARLHNKAITNELKDVLLDIQTTIKGVQQDITEGLEASTYNPMEDE